MGFASYWVGEMIDLSLMVHFDYTDTFPRTTLKWTILNDWEKYTDKGLLQKPSTSIFQKNVEKQEICQSIKNLFLKLAASKEMLQSTLKVPRFY